MPSIKVNQINIYYEIHGNGNPLIIIMGLGSDIYDFRGIINQLSYKHRVIAFDNRGTGRTDKPKGPYTIDQMADDTAYLLKKLDIENADIVGISMGGRIALSLSLNHPSLVNKLVLVCTSAKARGKLKMSWIMRLLLPFRNIIRSKYPQPRYAYKAQLHATLTYEAVNRLSEIKAPTIILHGKKDKTAPYTQAIALHEGIKSSKLVKFNGGHLFFIIGENQKFLDNVEQFLE